ncbi:MAG: hypothetical protein WBM00_12190 [Solirubrobacterales bacterium]
MAVEITPEHALPHRLGPAGSAPDVPPTPFESGALRLLACGALVVLLVCLLILPSGPSEADETLSWVLAFALALPGGLVLAAYQARRLASAAPGAAPRALAIGLALLATAFFLRRVGVGDQLHHGLLAAAAAGALASPFFAAWRWRSPNDRAAGGARTIALASVSLTVALFLPVGARQPDTLIPAVVLAALALLLVRFRRHRALPLRARRLVDIASCAIIALAAIQLPDIVPYAPFVVHHHGFFLGPANDALHGRAMLGSAWSQYGVGLIDALGVTFSVVPIGFGTLALVVVTLTAAQYVCVYLILRLAGLGQVLAVLTVAVAGAGNLFAPLGTYLAFPSDSPLRFGLPYLIILCAVIGARKPARVRVARLAMLVLVAVAAVWSFEAFVYCAATYGVLLLVEAVCAGTHIVRIVLRGVVKCVAMSAAAVLLFSLFTLIFDGHLDWGPYVEYLRLYTAGGLGQLPVVFFSTGPLMAAAIFLSAVTLFWLAHDHPQGIAPPLRAAIAGSTGLATATFTYYLGRSHPNNLLILLIPVVMLGGLWVQVLLMAPNERWRTALIGAIALGGAMIAVGSWPSVQQKWGDTALALGIPGEGGSLRLSIERLADNPVFDERAPVGVALLASHLPPQAPALVLTEPDLTTEILVRADRRNLLPISHPPEDVLIQSSRSRVRVASENVAPGTLLLTSPVPRPPGEVAPTGAPRDFNELQRVALSVLHQRFAFRLLQRARDGLELVRLIPKRAT